LTEVFNRIIQHHKFDAFEKFEEISHLIKKTHLKITDPKKDSEVNQPTEASLYEKGVNDFVENCRSLFEEKLSLSKEE